MFSSQYDPDESLFELIFPNVVFQKLKENSGREEESDNIENTEVFEETFTAKLSSKVEVDIMTNKHMEFNKESKTYTCSLCQSFQTGLKKIMTFHIMKHLKLYTHVCDICKKKFRQQCNYLRHLKIHTKLKSEIKGRKRTPKKVRECDKTQSEIYSNKTEVEVEDISQVSSQNLQGKLIRKPNRFTFITFYFFTKLIKNLFNFNSFHEF